MNIPGIPEFPRSIEIARTDHRFIEAVRADGLRVFFDLRDDKVSRFLNQLRISAPPLVLLRGVGIVRGAQISQNYAERYCPELAEDIRVGNDRFIEMHTTLLKG